MSDDLSKSPLPRYEFRDPYERDLEIRARLDTAENHARMARANRALLEKRETDEFTSEQFEKALDRHLRMLVALDKTNGIENDLFKGLTPSKRMEVEVACISLKRLVETLEDMSTNRSPRVLLTLEAVRRLGSEGRDFACRLLKDIDLGKMEWPTDAGEFLNLVEEEIGRTPQRFIQYVRTPTQTQIKLPPYKIDSGVNEGDAGR